MVETLQLDELIEDYPKIQYKKNLKMNFWVFF